MSDEILTKLQAVFTGVFGAAANNINRETTASNVDGWDSVAQVMLITSIEKEFGVKFASREVVGFKTVGGIADILLRKLPQSTSGDP